ncbi:MAG TPA: NAD(P)H-dependent oxidoreductase [Mycobacteriales bacterium]|nr:NAD(P)H-dependent oxidoreductase [Mycobacteriales bacterium]
MRIAVILGTTREGRFSEKVGSWVMPYLRARADIEPELVDLRDHVLPPFDGPSPIRTPRTYRSAAIAAFGAVIDRADGFIVITAEYNHGYPGELKNAIDHLFVEWNRKPVSFIGYGNAGGARAIEQLREVAVELELAPLRHAVHVLPDVMRPVMQAETADPSLFSELDGRLTTLVDDLVWWAEALKVARSGAPSGA